MYVIREAVPADNDRLLDLERRSPLDLGAVILTFDRAPNYFAHQLMQPHGRVLVAETGNEIAAVVAGAWHDVLLDGELHRLLYVHQGRTAPEHRRQHVASDVVLRNVVLALEDDVEAPYWLISPDNKTSMAFGTREGMHIWPVTARVDGFDVRGRRAPSIPVCSPGPADIRAVVELVNRTHSGRQMFLPYTVDSFERRLRQCPAYGWQSWRGVRSGGELVAAAGMWDFDCSLRITVREKESRKETSSLPAYVLDYGFVEGAEGAMAEVFMTLMAEASIRGRNSLSIALPEGEPIFQAMEALPDTPTYFRVITAGLAPPARFERSIYLDPVYI